MATLVHISRQLSASLASPERLDVAASSDLFAWRDPGEADAVQWLEFLRLFPGVKRLEVSSTLASIVASAFEQVTRTSDILPSLSELHMGGSQASTSSSIEGFASPITLILDYRLTDNRDQTYEVARVDSDHVPIVPPTSPASKLPLDSLSFRAYWAESAVRIPLTSQPGGCSGDRIQYQLPAVASTTKLTDELPQRSFSIPSKFYRTSSVNRSSKLWSPLPAKRFVRRYHFA
ncbi:hypothetical protein EDB84DRAFT_1679460 [Lactarius hengduanensis]|nr:hypothetical protein EDB84DRAFT_1679460 [Lactarius hengduanensis]